MSEANGQAKNVLATGAEEVTVVRADGRSEHHTLKVDLVEAEAGVARVTKDGVEKHATPSYDFWRDVPDLGIGDVIKFSNGMELVLRPRRESEGP